MPASGPLEKNPAGAKWRHFEGTNYIHDDSKREEVSGYL
jgi:hypothetical protein